MNLKKIDTISHDPYPTRLPIMHELTSTGTYPLVAPINHTSLIYIKAIDL